MIKKMKECEECGKKLGILKGYHHPTMGKKYYLCSKCWDHVSYSVEKWKEFVISNSFNTKDHGFVNFYFKFRNSDLKTAKPEHNEKNINITKSQEDIA